MIRTPRHTSTRVSPMGTSKSRYRPTFRNGSVTILYQQMALYERGANLTSFLHASTRMGAATERVRVE